MTDDLSCVSLGPQRLNSSHPGKNQALSPTALKSYIDNLKSNVSLNKQIVHALFYSKSNESLEDTSTSLSSNKALETFLQENRVLEEKVEQAMLERNEFQTKSLLNEQIRNEWEASHKELIDDYKEQIAELELQNQRKDKAINEMKHANMVLKMDADLANKSKFVFEVKPSKDVLAVHCLVEEVREGIEEKAREIFLMQTKQKMLNELIEEAERKILMVRALLANPVNRKNNLEKKDKTEFFEHGLDRKVEELDLSPIGCQNNSFTSGVKAFDPEIQNCKASLKEKSEKLVKISSKNIALHKENKKLLNQNEQLQNKVKNLHSDYYKEDMTMEINQEYENSLCYKLQGMSLDSINEIDVNHSNFYENDSYEDRSP